MRILIIDQNAEAQANLARLIDAFDQSDKDSLDIVVNLASDKDFTSRLVQTDVVIMGAALGEEANEIARLIKKEAPSIEIIMFTSDTIYSGGAFRTAHLLKIRKVIPASASPLDLLQELVSIHIQFRNAGKAKKGSLTVFTQAKGGVGTTTLVAALGEICSEARQHTLLWDLDIESRDLSRATSINPPSGQLITECLNHTKELNRNNLREAASSITPFLSLLPPPNDTATGMDLVGHPDSVKTIHRLIELGRILYDNILVDIAGKLSPATGTLLHAADRIVVLIDDSLLGISAVHAYLDTLIPLVKNNKTSIRFICSGTKLPTAQIARIVNEKISFDAACWDMPAIPIDSIGAEKWIGTGKSLYSMGQRSTKRALMGIADCLGIISTPALSHHAAHQPESTSSLTPFFGKLPFLKTSNA